MKKIDESNDIFLCYKKEFGNAMLDLEDAFEKGDILKTISMLRFLTHNYYSINYKLYDRRLEEITTEISKKFLDVVYLRNDSNNTVVFYDGFGLLNRGLAQIYIEGLLKLGYKVVWLLYDFLSDIGLINCRYNNIKNLKIIVLPKKNILDRMILLRDTIQNLNPKHIFIYTTPDDVVGIGVLSLIRGNVIRYLIDLTDHAFWLGKCAADKVIAFRNYGCNIEKYYRCFDESQITLLPFYPSDRTEYNFEGLPFDVNESDFIFSGGSSYKIEGAYEYENIVEYILEKYTSMKFVYASNDENMILKKLKGKFRNQFYHICERKDLDKIMKKCKFYLSTYPICGGLMVQYAIQNNCIPVSLSNDDFCGGDARTFILHPENAKFMSSSLDDIKAVIDKLICDTEYYKTQKIALKGQIVLREDFELALEELMLRGKTSYKIIWENPNIEKFQGLYKTRLRYEDYVKMIIESRNQWVYKRHPELTDSI